MASAKKGLSVFTWMIGEPISKTLTVKIILQAKQIPKKIALFSIKTGLKNLNPVA
ncbi:hypothetical protein [Endozoicomonas sp. ONNA2]|uniref:hypothetical protein n=1 Tax=Endozoicomonas sp. ONNA2 TaxID=2828741 RepID=UPI0021498205|nr:hypothetical protein [Endozoicomonas sp. ONNA2]